MKRLSVKQMTVLAIFVGISWFIISMGAVFSVLSNYLDLSGITIVVVFFLIWLVFIEPLADKQKFRREFKRSTGFEPPVSFSGADVSEWWHDNIDIYQNKRKKLESELDSSINQLRAQLTTELGDGLLDEYSDAQRAAVYIAVTDVSEKRNRLMNFIFKVNEVKT